MRRAAFWTLAIAAALVGAAAALRPRDTASALRRGGRRLMQRTRCAQGRITGMHYRLGRRTPAPDVPDDVLADRVRSELGPLEKRLDTPRVHVIADDHVVLLHGDVPGRADAVAIERAVRAVSGVRGVESYLHAGLSAGATRPSSGRAQHDASASPALRQLLSAAHDTGATTGQERSAVRAVLATFADRVPDEERAHLFAHVPADVRALAAPPRRYDRRAARLRTVGDLVATIATGGGMDAAHAEPITEAVLGCLRQLVPEEAADVAATLPAELRELWVNAVPS
jgi:uncharacterized protein (DUF2267 family)